MLMMMNYKPKYKKRQNRNVKGQPGIGFKLTNNGDYDLSNRKLVNVSSATEDTDATNLATVKNEIHQKLINIAPPTTDNDAVNLKTLNDKILEKAVTFSDKYSTISLSRGKKKYRLIDCGYIPDDKHLDDTLVPAIWVKNNTLSLSDGSTYNARKRQITNVGDPIQEQDVVTKKYLQQFYPVVFTSPWYERTVDGLFLEGENIRVKANTFTVKFEPFKHSSYIEKIETDPYSFFINRDCLLECRIFIEHKDLGEYHHFFLYSTSKKLHENTIKNNDLFYVVANKGEGIVFMHDKIVETTK